MKASLDGRVSQDLIGLTIGGDGKGTPKRISSAKVRDLLEGLRMAFDDKRFGSNDIPGLKSLAEKSGLPEAQRLVDTLIKGAVEITGTQPRSKRFLSPSYISNVLHFHAGAGAGWNANNPDVVKGRPIGAGIHAGAVEVLTLGRGGSIEFELGRSVKRGITVYGNGFIGLNGAVSADPARLEAFDPVRRRWVELGVIADSPVMIAPGNGILPSTPAAGGDRFLFSSAGIAPNTPIKRFRITDLGQGPAIGTTAGFDLAGAHGF